MILDEIKTIRSANSFEYRHHLQRLVVSKELEELLATWLTRFLSGVVNVFDTDTVANGSQIVIYKDDWIILGMRYLPALSSIDVSGGRESPYLVSNPTHNLVGVVGGSLRMVSYEICNLMRNDVLNRSVHLKRCDERTVAAGEIFEQRPTHDVLDVREVATGVALVELALRAQHPLVWHFERGTLRACGVSSSNVHATRQQFAAATLRHLLGRQAFPDLASLAESSPFHFVRWSALKHLLELDTTQALPVLRRAMNDEHPHVRSAAERTLEKLTAAGING